MAKLLGPDFIALNVRDLDVAKRFYTEQLGMTVADRSPPDAVVFDTKPIPFALRRPVIDMDAVPHLGWGVALWLACDDADSLHDRLTAADVAIVAAPADGPFGRFFTFRDPDGYAITAHGAPEAEQ
jgi:predicted enzyme related to lactoylglutathione lyase